MANERRVDRAVLEPACLDEASSPLATKTGLIRKDGGDGSLAIDRNHFFRRSQLTAASGHNHHALLAS
jgi:hypothetical protein